jgi:dihydrofolate reductase
MAHPVSSGVTFGLGTINALLVSDQAVRTLRLVSPLYNLTGDVLASGLEVGCLAKLVYALNQSLDGYVDHEKFAPRPALFRHFIEDVRGLSGMVYGRRLYQIMRYWDEDHAGWDAKEHDYAAAWRSQPKWVVSRSLKSVGPNATLVADDIEAMIQKLKAQLVGEIEVGGPDLAGALTGLGLIDEYRLYLHPIVLGSGKPFFSGPLPALRLVTTELIAEDVIRLTYAPAAKMPGELQQR